MLSQILTKKTADFLDMPKDVAMNLPKIVLNGTLECFCAGCSSVNKYTSEEIKLSVKRNVICIKGKKLLINSIEDEEVSVSGIISAIEFI